MHLNRTFRAAVLAVALLPLLVARPAAAADKVVMLFTPTTGHVALFVAANQGIFQKNGLDLDLELAANGSAMPMALSSNAAQIAAPTVTVLLTAADAGLDIVAIGAPEAYPSTTKAALLVRPDSPIKSAKDLEGKKIGTPGINGILNVMAAQWISVHGGNLAKVNFVEVQIPALNDALKSGQVDAVVSVDPFLTRTVDQNIGRVLSEVDTIIPDGSYVAVYAASRSWAMQHLTAVRAFQQSLKEAIVFMRDPKNHDAVVAALQKYTQLPAAVLNTAKLPEHPVSVPNPDGLKPMIALAISRGLIKKAPDANSLVIR